MSKAHTRLSAPEFLKDLRQRGQHEPHMFSSLSTWRLVVPPVFVQASITLHDCTISGLIFTDVLFQRGLRLNICTITEPATLWDCAFNGTGLRLTRCTFKSDLTIHWGPNAMVMDEAASDTSGDGAGGADGEGVVVVDGSISLSSSISGVRDHVEIESCEFEQELFWDGDFEGDLTLKSCRFECGIDLTVHGVTAQCDSGGLIPRMRADPSRTKTATNLAVHQTDDAPPSTIKPATPPDSCVDRSKQTVTGSETKLLLREPSIMEVMVLELHNAIATKRETDALALLSAGVTPVEGDNCANATGRWRFSVSEDSRSGAMRIVKVHTSLMLACKHGCPRVVSQLVQRHPEGCAQLDMDRLSVYHLAVVANASDTDIAKVISALIRHDRSSPLQLHVAQGQGGLVPIHHAIENNMTDTVKAMISVQPLPSTEDGLTCLHLAARHGNRCIIAALVGAGADVSALSLDQRSRCAQDCLRANRGSNANNSQSISAHSQIDAARPGGGSGSGVPPEYRPLLQLLDPAPLGTASIPRLAQLVHRQASISVIRMVLPAGRRFQNPCDAFNILVDACALNSSEVVEHLLAAGVPASIPTWSLADAPRVLNPLAAACLHGSSAALVALIRKGRVLGSKKAKRQEKREIKRPAPAKQLTKVEQMHQYVTQYQAQRRTILEDRKRTTMQPLPQEDTEVRQSSATEQIGSALQDGGISAGGDSVAHFAAISGSSETLGALMALDGTPSAIDFDTKNMLGQSPLMMAAETGDRKAVGLLLQRSGALQQGQATIASLLGKQADPDPTAVNAIGSSERSAMAILRRNGHLGMNGIDWQELCNSATGIASCMRLSSSKGSEMDVSAHSAVRKGKGVFCVAPGVTLGVRYQMALQPTHADAATATAATNHSHVLTDVVGSQYVNGATGMPRLASSDDASISQSSLQVQSATNPNINKPSTVGFDAAPSRVDVQVLDSAVILRVTGATIDRWSGGLDWIIETSHDGSQWNRLFSPTQIPTRTPATTAHESETATPPVSSSARRLQGGYLTPCSDTWRVVKYIRLQRFSDDYAPLSPISPAERLKRLQLWGEVLAPHALIGSRASRYTHDWARGFGGEPLMPDANSHGTVVSHVWGKGCLEYIGTRGGTMAFSNPCLVSDSDDVYARVPVEVWCLGNKVWGDESSVVSLEDPSGCVLQGASGNDTIAIVIDLGKERKINVAGIAVQGATVHEQQTGFHNGVAADDGSGWIRSENNPAPDQNGRWRIEGHNGDTDEPASCLTAKWVVLYEQELPRSIQGGLPTSYTYVPCSPNNACFRYVRLSQCVPGAEGTVHVLGVKHFEIFGTLCWSKSHDDSHERNHVNGTIAPPAPTSTTMSINHGDGGTKPSRPKPHGSSFVKMSSSSQLEAEQKHADELESTAAAMELSWMALRALHCFQWRTEVFAALSLQHSIRRAMFARHIAEAASSRSHSNALHQRGSPWDGVVRELVASSMLPLFATTTIAEEREHGQVGQPAVQVAHAMLGVYTRCNMNVTRTSICHDGDDKVEADTYTPTHTLTDDPHTPPFNNNKRNDDDDDDTNQPFADSPNDHDHITMLPPASVEPVFEFVLHGLTTDTNLDHPSP